MYVCFMVTDLDSLNEIWNCLPKRFLLISQPAVSSIELTCLSMNSQAIGFLPDSLHCMRKASSPILHLTLSFNRQVIPLYVVSSSLHLLFFVAIFSMSIFLESTLKNSQRLNLRRACRNTFWRNVSHVVVLNLSITCDGNARVWNSAFENSHRLNSP